MSHEMPKLNLDKIEHKWNCCKTCGKEMNPVQALLSSTHHICGGCTDKEVKKLK